MLANRLSLEKAIQNNLNHNIDLKYDIVVGSIADSKVSEYAYYIENGILTIKDISVYDILTKEGRTLGMQMSLHTKESLGVITSIKYDKKLGRDYNE